MKIVSPLSFGPLMLCGILISIPGQSRAAATLVDLGSAGDFGVLANTAITVTGNTLVIGDAGTASGTAITGMENLTLTGTDHGGDSVTINAQADLVTAYQSVLDQPSDFTYGAGADLGGLTLGPGVHRGISSLGITGILTLDAGGDPNAVWIFDAGSTLTTAANSSVSLVNGAQASNILWQVGSSATLGISSGLEGNLLALTSITLTTGATVQGGVYARNGAVTFDTNTVGVPEPTSGLLALAGLLGFAGLRRR